MDAEPMSSQHSCGRKSRSLDGNIELGKNCTAEQSTENEVINVRIFSVEDILEDIFERLERDDFVKKSKRPELDRFRRELVEEIRQRYPELDHVERIQRQRLTTTRLPETSFRDSGKDWKTYLLEDYREAIEDGYLPVEEIDDPELRKRVSSEISRGTLPKELDGVCVTRKQKLDGFREAVAGIARFDDYMSRQFASFARSLVAQYRR